MGVVKTYSALGYPFNGTVKVLYIQERSAVSRVWFFQVLEAQGHVQNCLHNCTFNLNAHLLWFQMKIRLCVWKWSVEFQYLKITWSHSAWRLSIKFGIYFCLWPFASMLWKWDPLSLSLMGVSCYFLFLMALPKLLYNT